MPFFPWETAAPTLLVSPLLFLGQKKIFFGHPKKFGDFDCVGPLLRVPGGYPRGGVENSRCGLLYHFPALDFEKQNNRKKNSWCMPPPGPPHGPLPRPPIFLNFFFSFGPPEPHQVLGFSDSSEESQSEAGDDEGRRGGRGRRRKRRTASF